MQNITLYIITFLVCVSCKSLDTTKSTLIESEVPITNTIVEYKDRLVYDSIYIHDSICTFIKGDTVIKYKEKTNIRFINRTDTIIRNDTIKVPITINHTNTEIRVKEVNILYWWQKTFISIGIVSLLSIIIYFITKLKKI